MYLAYKPNQMKKRYSYILLLIALLPAMILLSSFKQEKTIVQGLQSEYLSSPLAVGNANPLLSWRLKSGQRGKSQSAYRILVASKPSLLKVGQADYWDSGIVPSRRTAQVKYEGNPLSSRLQVYWKVMVWDEEERPSAWSEVATWSMGLLEPSDWTARWIALQEDPYPDSTLTHPAPYFRKELFIGKPVKKAIAYVCGLGFYEMYMNGKKVGDQVLAPAVTNYDKRIIQKILYQYDDQSTQRVLYNTFDVTGLLQKGNNTLGAILGNGWYNQRDRTVEGCMWYDTPRMLLQLEIEYTDGTTASVKTDETWKCTTGPLLHDGIFTGEVYDARKDLGAWNQNNYDDSQWRSSLMVRAPTGQLFPQLAPPDKITRILQPEFEGRINDSVYRYKLPEMISGWAELNVKGKAGSRLKLRFIGEEEEDFGQFDTYTLKGEGQERWEPRFTWHTFRSIEAITHDVEMNKESLVVKVVHTDPLQAGHFACSNELFNQVNESYLRTQKANFHGSISSDCPHRERLAYTGDGQVIVESSLLTFDMTQFYRKWFDDMEDARNKTTGYVPHTAPFGGGGGGPAWGSAYVIMPWAYYCYYGDKTILEQHYQGMKQWVHYLSTRTDSRGIVVKEEPNGWCLGDWCTPRNVEIPEPLVNTAYYYHVASLMAKVAKTLGKEEDCAAFTKQREQIKTDFNAAFFHPETNHYWEGRQGADVFPLAFGLVPDGKEEAVFAALCEHLKQIGYHFDTGILATPLLLQVLTDHGRADLAYKLMDQRSEPGFSYLLDERYTCLWEYWDGRGSRCHPMFGSVVAWFYKTLGGIRMDASEPMTNHILIAPHPVSELTYCNSSYLSVYGMIRSDWHIKNGSFELTVEIPANTTATIQLPCEDSTLITESGAPLGKARKVKLIGTEGKQTIVAVASGIYRFTVKGGNE